MARQRCAIVGTGLIGRGWAVVFARAGWDVRLWDENPRQGGEALDQVAKSLDDLADVGLVTDAAEAKALVVVCRELEQAVDDVSWVQENVPENVDVKADVFARLDRVAPPAAILASSASALPGSSFFAHVRGRDRCIVAHPANPPHLMPVVEIVPSPWHAPETIARCRSILSSVGQCPVVVHGEVPGFVMNRLQAAVVGEAMSLIERGIIDPDDLDAVMANSLGLRWSFLGPLATMDLNAPGGFRDYAQRYQQSYSTLASDLGVAHPWTEEAINRVEAARRRQVAHGSIAERQRWRDRRLMRLLRHRADVDNELGC